LLFGRAIEEAQQSQHGDFWTVFTEMPQVGSEQMPRVVAMLGVLIEKRNLAPPPDLVVVCSLAEVRPQQHEGIRMAVGVLHCLAQFPLGAADLQLPQQLRAGRRLQPVQRLLDDGSSDLVLELHHRLPRSDHAKPAAGRGTHPTSGQRKQQGTNGRVFQLAQVEGRWMLERLDPVEHQKAVLLDQQPGERAPLLGGIDEPGADVAEVIQGLFEEELR